MASDALVIERLIRDDNVPHDSYFGGKYFSISNRSMQTIANSKL